MSKTIKIVSLIVFVGAFGALAYGMLSNKAQSQTNDPLLSSGTTGAAVNVPAQTSDSEARLRNVLSLLTSLNAVKLDTKFFTSQDFTSLEDISQPLQPATDIGRPNPFAPIGINTGTIPTDTVFGASSLGGGASVIDGATSAGGTGTTTTPTDTGTQLNSIVTNPATQIARTTAVISATLTNSVSATATKSFAYGTTQETLLRATTITTAGQTFTSTLTNLAPNTTYYVKAIIQVSGVTFSGNTITFKTAN
jgi:hypothetical protein